MQTSPYLTFDGRCEEAFKFYENLLRGQIVQIMTFQDGQAMEDVPPEWGKKIMHVALNLGSEYPMGSDTPPQYYKPPQGFSVSLSVDGTSDAERIFNALAEGGTVGMPLQQTFWAARFGMVTDRFGIPWMISSEQNEQTV